MLLLSFADFEIISNLKNVDPDLDTNCFQRLSADDKSQH